MKVRATVATIATNIAIVKDVVKKGEKVFKAYILSSIRFNCCLCVGWSARLFSLCSSVFNRNEWAITPSRYGCTIGAKKKSVKFFFKLFFRRVCGRGVCGRGVWGGGIGMGRAGWGGLGMGRAG